MHQGAVYEAWVQGRAAGALSCPGCPVAGSLAGSAWGQQQAREVHPGDKIEPEQVPVKLPQLWKLDDVCQLLPMLPVVTQVVVAAVACHPAAVLGLQKVYEEALKKCQVGCIWEGLAWQQGQGLPEQPEQLLQQLHQQLSDLEEKLLCQQWWEGQMQCLGLLVAAVRLDSCLDERDQGEVQAELHWQPWGVRRWVGGCDHVGRQLLMRGHASESW